MRRHNTTEDMNIIERGFTLIELLVVIVILGVLAGIVVFAVSGISDRGKSSSCKTEVQTVNTAIQAYNAKDPNGGWPSATDAASLFTALNTAGLIQSSAPGSTASYSPTYNASTHVFSASCP